MDNYYHIGFYDTCAFLDSPPPSGEKYGISAISLYEMEDIKTSHHKDADIKLKARHAARRIKEDLEQGLCIVMPVDTTIMTSDTLNNDQKILLGYKDFAYQYPHSNFITSDIQCWILAKSQHIPVEFAADQPADVYTGSKTVYADNDTLAQLYTDMRPNYFNALINEYVILVDEDNQVLDKLKWNGSSYVKLSYKRKSDFKPLNIYQEMAFDMMEGPTPIKILIGTAGSGKTYINLKFALSSLRSGAHTQIIYIHDPIGKGSRLGHLPGTKYEKIVPYALGLIDNLDGGYDELLRMSQDEQLVLEAPSYMKGASKSYAWFLVDEAEDLDTEMIKLIGTRVAQGSTICLSGDLTQTEKCYTLNNGLRTFIEKFKGNPLVGIVTLQDDVRSSTSRLFSSI